MTDTTKHRKPGSRKPIYKANYGDATTLSNVTMAVLRYRPDKPRKAAEKPGEDSPGFNPSV